MLKLYKLRLQVFFILLKVYNIIYCIFFPFFIRRILLKISGVKIGHKSIVQSVRFFSFGKLVIGDNSIINTGCYLDNRRGIYIGNNVVIAHNTKLYTLGHDYNDIEFKTKGSPIYIDDYTVIFSNVLVMPGVHIGRGAVVLSGSVVTRDVDPNTIVGGSPAKVIKKRDILHSNRPHYKYWFSI